MEKETGKWWIVGKNDKKEVHQRLRKRRVIRGRIFRGAPVQIRSMLVASWNLPELFFLRRTHRPTLYSTQFASEDATKLPESLTLVQGAMIRKKSVEL